MAPEIFRPDYCYAGREDRKQWRLGCFMLVFNLLRSRGCQDLRLAKNRQQLSLSLLSGLDQSSQNKEIPLPLHHRLPKASRYPCERE
jgi:hypothetical protein